MTEKMTATETLRQLLDERGVVYSREGCETFFKNVHIWAINDKELCISISGLSPEQAIAATLGRGTCRMCKRKGYDREHLHHYECSECGEEVLRSSVMGESEPPRFCPECGRRVES